MNKFIKLAVCFGLLSITPVFAADDNTHQWICSTSGNCYDKTRTYNDNVSIATVGKRLDGGPEHIILVQCHKKTFIYFDLDGSTTEIPIMTNGDAYHMCQAIGAM